jgi:acyl carrier protein
MFEPITIRSVVLNSIASQLGVLVADLEKNPSFYELACDSIDLLEVVMRVEDELKIEIDETKFPNEGNTTVNEFIAHVEKATAA